MFTWGFVRSNFFFDMLPSFLAYPDRSTVTLVAAGGLEPPTQRL
jgi:hypothetical protein